MPRSTGDFQGEEVLQSVDDAVWADLSVGGSVAGFEQPEPHL